MSTYKAAFVLLLASGLVAMASAAHAQPETPRSKISSDVSAELRSEIERLYSPDVAIRAKAIMSLRYLAVRGEADAAVPFLMRMLGSGARFPSMTLMTSSLAAMTKSCSREHTFGGEAAETLARIGRTSDELLALVKHRDWRVRANAMRALGGCRDGRAVEPMVAALTDKDENPEVSGNAALALGAIGGARALEPLAAALKHKDSRVRGAAACALGRLRDPGSLRPLAEALEDDAPYVRMQATIGLGRIGGTAALEPLLQALRSEHREVRAVAALALRRTKDRRVVEPLIAALADPYANVQINAARTLGRMRDPRALEPLIGALGDRCCPARSAAAAALGELGDPRALRPLVAMVLRADEHDISALTALTQLGHAGAAKALREHRSHRADWDEWWRRNRDDLLLLPPVGATVNPAHYTRLYEAGPGAIEAGFVPDEPQIILGQPSFITFTVINRSDTPYRFRVGGDSRGSVRHNSFRITAADAHGTPVRDPYSYNNFGGFGQNLVLTRGQNYSERLFLGHWCAFDRPGLYTVTCRRVLSDFGKEPKSTTVTISSSFELTIAPFEEQQMRRVIAGLGDKLREGGHANLYEASLALAAIADEAVVAHLVYSLSHGDYQNKLEAIRGLCRFPSDAVADGLTAALKDRDHVIRDAAVRALCEIGKVDRAPRVLIPEMSHESASVRAAAAQALGVTKAKEAFGVLLAAVQDREPTVRHAAAIALGSLGHKEALQPLMRCLEDQDMGLRVAAAKGLRALGEPLRPEWLVPVIRTVTDLNDQSFHEAIRLIRLYGGEKAASALVSCLDFDDPSPRNSRNMFLILAIHHCPGGPKHYYRFHSDPNSDGTPEQLNQNRMILAELRMWLAENGRGSANGKTLHNEPAQ